MSFTKEEFVKQLDIAGDACIHFISAISGKEKYVVGTMDFTTKYIDEKFKKLKSSKPKAEGSVLIFSWDTDSFKQVDPATVLKIEPLNQMILNERL
jgi:hypothetical protein